MGWRSLGAMLGVVATAVATACLLPATEGLTGGAADGGGDVDGGDAGSTCDATFCDDFDDGPLGAKWTELVGMDSGYLSLGDAAVSAPNALRIDVPDGGTRETVLRAQLPVGREVRCDFFLKTDALPPPGKGGDILVIDYGGTGGVLDTEVRLELDSTGLCLREDVVFLDGGCGCPSFRTPAVGMASGFFVRVGVVVDFATVRLFLNGLEMTSHALTPTTPTTLKVSLGSQYVARPLLAHVDDFQCTVKP